MEQTNGNLNFGNRRYHGRQKTPRTREIHRVNFREKAEVETEVAVQLGNVTGEFEWIQPIKSHEMASWKKKNEMRLREKCC